MFTPMAITVLMALLGAALLSITFLPAAVALLVTGRVSEHENWFMRLARRAYVPLLDVSIRARGLVARPCRRCSCRQRRSSRRAWAASSSRAWTKGDIAMHAMRVPGTSLTPIRGDAERARKSLQGISGGEGGLREDRNGRGRHRPDAAERSPTDYVMLKPRAEWPDPTKLESDAGYGRDREGASRRFAGNATTNSPSRSRCASTS